MRSGSPGRGGRQACRIPHQLSASTTGPSSAPASVSWYQIAPPADPLGTQHSTLLQLTQPPGEDLGGDAAQPGHQIREPLGVADQIAHHEQAPPVADLVESTSAPADHAPTHSPCLSSGLRTCFTEASEPAPNSVSETSVQ